ncbi:heme exporter protein CcmD [Parahaliea aestuarii]|uniref:Heme exporter protein D n=1 Tax=Parahaliea aestuarii TaxID=1852021 RepID=A0A5C8ZT17_9GAMM|nr:heme exporter protein CcmD [Parahaliea aestuarii]TXS90934.1 heme exporter protein CcmD [Parahaliea aestuarii]
MYFDSLHAALAMEGHGPFVWAAYAITAVVLLTLLLSPVLRSRRLRRDLAGEIRRRETAAGEGRHASGT